MSATDEASRVLLRPVCSDVESEEVVNHWVELLLWLRQGNFPISDCSYCFLPSFNGGGGTEPAHLDDSTSGS
jgi:hypothetical protein